MLGSGMVLNSPKVRILRGKILSVNNRCRRMSWGFYRGLALALSRVYRFLVPKNGLAFRGGDPAAPTVVLCTFAFRIAVRIGRPTCMSITIAWPSTSPDRVTPGMRPHSNLHPAGI